jgi:heavy metal sensor kinase
MKQLPIRLRLTLWYCAMFAAAALLLSATSWWMLRRTLDATIRQDLVERVDDIQVQLQQLGPNFDRNAAQAQFDVIYRNRDDGKWLQISDETGRWIYRSARMAAVNPLVPAVNKPGVITEFAQGPRHVRALTSTLRVAGHVYTVQTGISMNKPRVLLHDFGLGLLLLTPAVLIAAALGGHFLSRKALAPVAAIAFEARRITERNLDTRLPVSETPDEISHLSLTLNHMLARIDTAFRSVRDFTANASHELRTPLARLRTEVEIALYRPRDAAEYREALEHIHLDALDMSGLLENLLTLARAEAGADMLRLAPVDLGSLLKSAARECEPIADRLALRLETRISPAEPLLVLGDQLSLLRLVRILLDNACKFTPRGGIISLSATLRGDSVLLAVEDSGIGIAPEHQARIFDRFYRVQTNGIQQKAGAGLGLSLAAWIAEQHRTRITVHSAAGLGARFSVELTRVQEAVAPAIHIAPAGIETAESIRKA